MALSADSQRAYEYNLDPLFNDLPVLASSTIYEGGAVGDNASGYMRALTSGDPFRGFADRQANNSTGASAAINVRLRTRGIVSLTVTGAAAVTDVGLPVFATADDTFTLTPGGTKIGIVVRWVTSTTALVYFDADQFKVWKRKTIIAKTADYTVVLPADDGKLFTTRGASAAVKFTLPLPASGNAGCEVECMALSASNLQISSTSANQFVTFNDLDADSVLFSTSGEIIGAHILARSDGTNWALTNLGAHTMTVTT